MAKKKKSKETDGLLSKHLRMSKKEMKKMMRKKVKKQQKKKEKEFEKEYRETSIFNRKKRKEIKSREAEFVYQMHQARERSKSIKKSNIFSSLKYIFKQYGPAIELAGGAISIIVGGLICSKFGIKHLSPEVVEMLSSIVIALTGI